MTNFCNLRCFSCVDRSGDDRPQQYTFPSDVFLFLQALKKFDPECAVILSGGEPSLHPDLEEIGIMIKKFGFTSIVLTNCAKSFDYNIFDRIILDNHGINKKAVESMAKNLSRDYQGEWMIKDGLKHYDIEIARTNHKTKGIHCYRWMMPNLWLDVVYPCVNLPAIDDWDGDTIAMDSLKKSGWTVKNPGISAYLKLWRTTLPGIIYKKCSLGCWADSKNLRWKTNE